MARAKYQAEKTLTRYGIDGAGTDGIDLTGICEKSQWHLGTAIDRLMAAGLDRADADAFAAFQFAMYAVEMGGVCDGKPEDKLTAEQWERLW